MAKRIASVLWGYEHDPSSAHPILLRPRAIYSLCCRSSFILELPRTRSMLRAFTYQIFNWFTPVQSFLSFPSHSTCCLCGSAAFHTPLLARALSRLHRACSNPHAAPMKTTAVFSCLNIPKEDRIICLWFAFCSPFLPLFPWQLSLVTWLILTNGPWSEVTHTSSKLRV